MCSTQEIAKNIKSILAKLKKSASGDVKNVISKYDQEADFEENKASLIADGMTLEVLKACGEFLNITKLESFPDKESLAERIVMQIETFFPTKCSECDEMYTVPFDKEVSPIFTCFLCYQKSHDCQAIQSKMQKLKDCGVLAVGMVWLCSGCYKRNEPLCSYSMSTTLVAAVDDQIDLTKSADNKGINPLATEIEGDNAHKKVENEVQVLCKFFKRNSCKHGMSGRSGGTCKYHHPKVCEKYKNGGKKACSGVDCDKWHPPICYAGLNTGSCFKANCRFWHGKRVSRKPKEIPSAPANPPQQQTGLVTSSHTNQYAGYDANRANQEYIQHFLAQMKTEVMSWQSQIAGQIKQELQKQYQVMYPPLQPMAQSSAFNQQMPNPNMAYQSQPNSQIHC